ncbi:gamma subunit of Oligosaccharyltransferase [Scheffersomyces xylosifermentans]|uniref:gamma subunit of Oligosaccharyltransferase n=1 Tax=Scheffersomyces xylosifermentans TaxID=1304137 RepID=UPI00315C72B8
MRVSILQFFAVFASLVSVGIAALSNDQLQNLVKGQGTKKVLTITDDNFAEILNGPRDYHIVVLLTSESSQINCVLCKEFRPEYELLANSWVQDHPNGLTEKELEVEEDFTGIPPKNIYFFYSEFMQSRNFFQIFQLNSIPKVFHFPPSDKAGPNNFIKEVKEYQFFQGQHSELLRSWIADQTGLKVNLYVPTDYYRIAVNFIGLVSILLLVRRFKKQVIQIITSRFLWSGFSLISILLLTTGYMFNQIRAVPYMRAHENGKLEYFIQGQQNQMGVETQIVSFIYGILSLLFVVLIKKVPEIKNSTVLFIAVAIVSVLIFIFYSLLLCVFSLKGMGYPYRFINFF